ncbi:hypothetical protein [Lyngbya sp. CCY1209]|uniref:hypothetical protein n=1 Tax=Lyngbya sp. CCY1209 TaxID=2886103 RepID=UPI002D20823E|nr:hypothetical protein [Lyngbya sp. CCY1209]MEB3883346.1 hypothetical protein [Lyngbya sp. CCY1209]
MAGSLKRIEQDIATLEEAIAKIAQEFHSCYDRYLQVLSHAVRQQLILATYHLCTQGYPEAFLQLSYSERQQLQAGIRDLAGQTQAKLTALVHTPIAENAPRAAQGKLNSAPQEETPEEPGNPEPPEATAASNPPAESLSELKPLLITPIRLLRWQENIEEAIRGLLHALSHDVNLLLQDAGIILPELPEALLEAASKADPPPEAAGGSPNLLNLTIETDDEDDQQNPNLTELITVHLRLSEIEFADPGVMGARHQIRNLVARLNRLGRDYQKKQRDRAVLEAESAWRSSWFEE